MAKKDKTFIYGRHAVMEALRERPQAVQEVFLTESVQEPELKEILRLHEIQINPLKQRDLEYFSAIEGGDIVHQGVVASIDSNALVVPFSTFINALTVTPDTALVVMGGLQDPRNVGAIIRSAVAFGAAGILLPEHNQAQITGSVIKTSAGTAFQIPLVQIGNVNQTLRTLKEKGFWIYGLSMEGTNELAQEKFDAPAVFVVGSEGEGIREKTLEHCDIHLRIPMSERAESLNASVSAALVLYEWAKQHPKGTAVA